MNETSEISETAQSAQNAATAPENYVMTYTYDANNRMTKQVKAGNGIESILKMGYDKNGNMTSRQRSSIGGPVGENTNMEISIGTMQSNPGSESVAETFSYNALNQMTGYQNSNGTNASYVYDATGMRTSKTVNGEMTKFYYNGVNIANEGNGENVTTSNFIGLLGIEGRKNSDDSNMAYFMKDLHGDVNGVISPDGTVLTSYEYDIWGNQKQQNATGVDNPFRYCSEYMDEETGLLYLRARYYDSNIGRFLQEDTAKDGLNWYVYCMNNPIAYFDSKGSEFEFLGKKYTNDIGKDIQDIIIKTINYTNDYLQNNKVFDDEYIKTVSEYGDEMITLMSITERRILDVPKFTQPEGSYLCWATTTAMINAYYAGTSEDTTIEIAKKTYGENGYDKEGNVGSARGKRFYAYTSDYQTSFENIKKLIDGGDPVVLDVNSGPGMAHYLLLTGYIEYSDGRREVTIIDPGNGKQTTISFDEISGNKGFNLDGYIYRWVGTVTVEKFKN